MWISSLFIAFFNFFKLKVPWFFSISILISGQIPKTESLMNFFLFHYVSPFSQTESDLNFINFHFDYRSDSNLQSKNSKCSNYTIILWQHISFINWIFTSMTYTNRLTHILYIVHPTWLQYHRLLISLHYLYLT